MKGLGGFHLVCRADSDEAVTDLRNRKFRDSKPFAVMVSTLSSARDYAIVSTADEDLLLSPAHPIVLCRKNSGDLSEMVAPGTSSYGLMLPYTPLHWILLSDCRTLEKSGKDVPLVMTSANVSGEPLCYTNEEAVKKLSSVCDYFLCHNRKIERPVDDSVYLSSSQTAPVPIRRSRGYVPSLIRVGSVPLPKDPLYKTVIVASGGDMKSAMCILSDGKAVMSEHLGELSSPESYRNYVRAGESLKTLLELEPSIAACDLHPGYHSSQWARGLGLEVIEVQHHHAHIVSAMAENNLTGDVIGLACDGTGYGDDGSIWGCEVFVCDEVRYKRKASVKEYPLPGGDKAARELFRPALSLFLFKLLVMTGGNTLMI